MSIRYDDSDFLRLNYKIKKLGYLPQKCVTKAAKKAAGIVRKAAKKKAPKGETGNLRRGIVLKGEKRRRRGKKVYQVTFSAAMNDVFRKPIKEPGKYGGKNPTGYYPMSLTFGFKTAKGKYEGNDFLDSAARENEALSKKVMMETLEKEIDKEWAKK